MRGWEKLPMTFVTAWGSTFEYLVLEMILHESAGNQ